MSRSKTRMPPKPAYYASAAPGQCRFCGDPVIQDGVVNERASWHSACAKKWMIRCSPSYARKQVFLRDRGICAVCGIYAGPADPEAAVALIQAGEKAGPLGNWELDHIEPLHRAKGDGRYFDLDNMQTLCHCCHRVKTRNEFDQLQRKEKS